VQDLVDAGLEKPHVVADHDQAALEGPQEVPQPDDRVGVEVVGRLVEQQRLGAGEQDPRELHPAALSSGEGLQRLGQGALGDVQARGDLPGLGLGGVPASRVQRGVRLLVAAHPPVAGVRVGRGHLLLRLPEPPHDLVEPPRGQDPVQRQHLPVAGAGVLREVPDAAGAGHRARRGQRLAGQDPGERRLSCPVATDQADLVAGRHPEGHVVHQQPRAGADLQMVGGDHGTATSTSRRTGR
jgi:hypothetical protein